MQTLCLQCSVVHAYAILLLSQYHVIVRLRELVCAVYDGVLAVEDTHQLDGGSPCMIVSTVHLGSGCGIGYLPCQLVILLPCHVVGGICYSGLVKDILVVEEHPDITTERKLIENIIYLDLIRDTAVYGKIQAIL